MSNFIELDKIKTLENSVDLIVQTTSVGMKADEDVLEDFEFKIYVCI